MGVSSYYMRFPEGKTKALTLSCDDGVEQDEQLIRLMEQYGFKGIFNLNAGLFAPEDKVYAPGKIHRRLPLSKIREIYSSPQARYFWSFSCRSGSRPAKKNKKGIAERCL